MTDQYKLTPEQKELVIEVRDWYQGSVDACIQDMEDKIKRQYEPNEHNNRGKKIAKGCSIKVIKRIKEDLPKIKRLKQIDDELKGLDPNASITDLL